MALVSLPQLKAFFGISDSSDDPRWLACLTAADSAVKTYLRWNPERVSDSVKYLDGSGVSEVVLPGLPVDLSVSEVKVDGNGGYGQVPNTFGSDTLLTVGVNYLVDAANGILRMWSVPTNGWWWIPGGGYVGPSRYWGGLATYGVRPPYWPLIPGCIKVTFSNGYTTIPADLQMGVCEMAAWLKRNAATGGMTLTSESWNGETYTLTQLVDEAYGALHLPVFGTTRQLLNNYREPVFSTGIR